MTAMYPVLRYPGNVTGSDQAQSGAMLGWDEIGRPYEVIDAEYFPGEDYTNVYLQYAAPETISESLAAAREQRGQVIRGPW